MQEDKKILTLLQVAVPGETVVTVQSEIKILEILGIISNPELVKSMDIAASLIPTSIPATLHGMVGLLGNIIKQHPKATKQHHETLSEVAKKISSMPDTSLTFSTFLPICEKLIEAIGRSKREEIAYKKEK